MKLTVQADVKQMFPDLCIGIVVAVAVENQDFPAELKAEVNRRAQMASSRVVEIPLAEDPRIVSWREAYQKMGVNPKKHTPTAESLIRRASKGKDLPTISSAVNSYLASELKYFLPVGGYDLDKITGDIALCRASGTETFEPLGEDAAESVECGEIIYRDNERVLTRRWNYRDAEPTKITPDTTRLVLCIESVSALFGDTYIDSCATDIAVLLRQFCHARVETAVLNVSETTEVTLPLV